MKDSTKNKRYLRYEALKEAIGCHHNYENPGKPPNIKAVLKTAKRFADFVINGKAPKPS